MRQQELHKLLKYYREKYQLLPKQVARQLGISYSYYMRLEQPYHEGKSIPSEDLLRKFADVVVKDEAEKPKALRELLRARTSMLIPPELFEEVVRNRKDFKEGTSKLMPEDFLKRLKQDVEYVGISKVVRALGCPQDFLEKVFEGKIALSRQEVIKLAGILDQPVEEYMVLAGYMPESLAKLLKDKESTKILFRIFKHVPASKLTAFLSKLEELLNLQRSFK